ncbi:MAG: glycoside hydrolase family 65 protein [Candidatus Omnitrophica bacterium]|nr:glycoside hydrolase family 65 protein [Candidatus Omnitrophota bacterium]
MKDYYSKYSGAYSWQIKEEGWVKSLQGVREVQLALGNGYWGSRAILEELPYEAKPGTYMAGVYDKVGSQVSELVNLPNPFNFKITADGEKLGVMTMDALQHRRILNLRSGILSRYTVFQDSKKRKYDYQSLRFISMHDKNIGVLQVSFTPLDHQIKISIETGIDISVYNSGTATEGRKRHFRVKELGQFNKEGYLIVETFGKLHKLIFRSGFYYRIGGRKTVAKDNVFELKVAKNQTVIFTKIFYIDYISQSENLNGFKKISEKKFRRAFKGGFNYLLKKHIFAWENLWKQAEVSIWGDPEIEKNFRFNIYHMLICAPCDGGNSSIGAKALTGEGYRGHIFWDTEIFLLPFYLYTLPEAARNILLYRYKRLDAARDRAKSFGFKGAMFPWESAGLGIEETPDRAKDLDGKIIKIHTGQMEQHITADIAYAFYHYYNVTQDEKFMYDYGYEVIFETARFWASRVEYNKRKKIYEIKHVIGPNEFQIDVNNNAFTNMMAKWNLLKAYKLFQQLKQNDLKLLRKLNTEIELTNKETKEWKKIAAKIGINKNKNSIIEQFDGYFRKKYIKITQWDENSLPIVSARLSPREYARTQFVKQADVVMLLYLLADVFNLRTKKKNYEYYLSRTLHNSSLSLPIYAIVAIDLGDRERAYRFFRTAIHTDISNIHNNTDHGIHAAGIGGTWQILVSGFAGVRIEKEILSINPKLPHSWRKVIFSLYWRGKLLKLEIKNNKITIQVSGNKKRIKIRVFGILHEIRGDKTFNFKRKELAKKKEASYL